MEHAVFTQALPGGDGRQAELLRHRDKQARHVASTKFALNVETTPKLYAWLHYRQHLGGGDHEDVIREHEMYEARPLTRFFQEAYDEAMRCRLMSKPVVTGDAMEDR